MTDLLTVKNLHAGYGRAEVLSGLNLRLPQGAVVTVIGPNGAGKSTTLNALMGVLPANGSDRLRWRGHRCAEPGGAGDEGPGPGAREA